jgi:C1A family cysteine protease
MKRQIALAVASCACLSLSALASPKAKLAGTVDIHIQPHTSQGLTANHSTPLTFKAMKLEFSKEAKKALAKRAYKNVRPTSFKTKSSLPEQVDLTMNRVPVLNQGMHGSCVTFATVGALDALIGKGDYVSPLCNLALGTYLEKKGYVPSGWDGSWGSLVLSQIVDYGIVAKDSEKGCGGLDAYPTNDQYETGQPMSVDDYYDKSEDLNNDFAWSPIISTEDVLHDEYDSSDAVKLAKTALNNGHRLTFGVLLDVYVGEAGASGKYRSRYGFDTWLMTPEIEKDLKEGNVNAGHEMVIYGYDDNAVVEDEDGREHKGIFILRNSWSRFAGDNGDYYMTYEYFQKMTLEAQKIY